MSLGGRWLRWAGGNLEEIAGVACFLVMVTSVSIGVLFRYGIRHPLIWTEDVSNFTFLWAVFLGAAAAAKRHEHIVVDTLVVLLPKPLQRAVGVVTGLLVAAMLGAIAVLGVQYALTQRGVTSEALEIPMVWWALAVPVSSALACGYVLRDVLRILRGPVIAPSSRLEQPLPQAAGEGGASR
jgi:TRAP-type C4-dicarboxylate transport system permease small subunit